jgi:UDP-N-acetyl-D-mannosaminuronic acid dehydrogenase
MYTPISSTFKDRKVTIVGLGFVGLTLAVVMAELGFKIVGIENNPLILDKLKRGKPHFFEPGLEDRFLNVYSNESLIVQSKFNDKNDSSVFIITVGTPLDSNGRVRLDMVQKVTQEISNNMRSGALIIGRSTVKVGTTGEVIRPILESSGKNFDLVFCPERTLEGKALEELKVLPQIIGSDSESGSTRATQIFQYITPTIIRVSNTRTAEMVKLIDNTSRDVQFAFANEVALMSDALGVSAYEVISSGKLGYPRTNLPLPGPVGGPCLSKDPHILMQSLSEVGFFPRITKYAREINEQQPSDVVDFIFNHRVQKGLMIERLNISLMGLAFKGKPETDDLRGSMAIPVLDELKERFTNSIISGYDKLVAKEEIVKMGLIHASTIEEASKNTDILIVLNNHPIFSSLSLTKLSKLMNSNGMIYDFWNHFSANKNKLDNGVTYIALGSHHKEYA